MALIGLMRRAVLTTRNNANESGASNAFAIATLFHKPADDPGQHILDRREFRGASKPGGQLLPVVEPGVVIGKAVVGVERQATQYNRIESVAQ